MGQSKQSKQSGIPPPSPWKNSKAKKLIIEELRKETSDIHLLLGNFSATNFKDVNFKQILSIYAKNKYKPGLFRENMKRLLKQFLSKTGPFKSPGVEPWFTSTKNVSRAYALLFKLHMDPKSSLVVGKMTAEEVWRSHIEFQWYDLETFIRGG